MRFVLGPTDCKEVIIHELFMNSMLCALESTFNT